MNAREKKRVVRSRGEEKSIQQEDDNEQQRNKCRRHRRWSSAVLDLFNGPLSSTVFQQLDVCFNNENIGDEIDNDMNIDDSPLSLTTVLDDADILERDILLDSCLFTAGDSQYIFENN